jgi:serine protease inhibitor
MDRTSSPFTGMNNLGRQLLFEAARARSNPNMLLSPAGIGLLLSMAANGAVGDTQRALLSAIGTGGLSLDDLNTTQRSLLSDWTQRSTDGTLTLALATSMLVAKEYAPGINPDYIAHMATVYDAAAHVVDFSAPESIRALNAWVQRQTHGHIPTIAHPGDFGQLTVLVLLNVLYFSGLWLKPFEEDETYSHPYHCSDGRTTTVSMMRQRGEFAYYETDVMQAIRLPYHGNMAMEIYAQRKIATTAQLLAFLSTAKWLATGDGFTPWEGRLSLPRFKLDCTCNITTVLEAVGIPLGGQYNHISRDISRIEEMRQAVALEVHERGTEATSATMLHLRALSVSMVEPRSFTMVVDRPFLFALRDLRSNSILFIGLVGSLPTR